MYLEIGTPLAIQIPNDNSVPEDADDWPNFFQYYDFGKEDKEFVEHQGGLLPNLRRVKLR